MEELSYLLKDSIKLRTRSDVDFGLYYSKGLDSSLIDTYFKFKNKFFFDDSKNWKSDFFKKIKQITYHLDLPVGSLSSYPLWKLAEMASKKVKVVITGEGADEIFSGYVRYLPIAREWALKNRYPTYKYLFEKFYPSYLEGFTKITARNENFDLVYKSLKQAMYCPQNIYLFDDFKWNIKKIESYLSKQTNLYEMTTKIWKISKSSNDPHVGEYFEGPGGIKSKPLFSKKFPTD